jgi:hypothetical protein
MADCRSFTAVHASVPGAGQLFLCHDVENLADRIGCFLYPRKAEDVSAMDDFAPTVMPHPADPPSAFRTGRSPNEV